MNFLIGKAGLLSRLIEGFRRLKELDPQSAHKLKLFLIYNYYKPLVILFISWAALAAASFRYIAEEFRKTSTSVRVILLIIINAAIVIRFFIMPHHPQVFFDEISFMETAENFYRYGINSQNYSGLLRNELLAGPMGWSFLISVVFHITGVSAKSAYFLAATLSVISVILCFFVTKMFMNNEKAGLWSAALLCLYPVVIRLSTSAAKGTPSIFFILLTLFSMLLYFKHRKDVLLYFVFINLAFTMNVRQEAFMVLLPLLLLFFGLFHPEIKKEFKNPHFYAAFTLFVIFTIMPVIATWYGTTTGLYFFYESPQLIRKHIILNLQQNITYWLANGIQPLSVTLLAIAGFVLLYRAERKKALFLAGWFIFLQIFYSLNPSADFSASYTLDSWRNAIHLLIPVIFLAGLTPVIIEEYFRQYYPRALPFVTSALIIALLLIPIRFAGFIGKKTVFSRDYLFVKKMTAQLPRNSVIIVDGARSDGFFMYYMNLFNYASSIPGHYYETFTPLKAYSARPMAKDFIKWKYREGRPVYLYLVHSKDLKYSRKFNWYHKTFDMKLAAGVGLRRQRTNFVLYSLEGFRDTGGRD